MDGIGAQEIAQGPNEVLLRRDADATGAEPDRLAVPVAPLNIEGRGTGVGGAERRRRPQGVRLGAAGERQRRLSATAPDALSSSSARAASTMKGAWSSPRSRSL